MLPGNHWSLRFTSDAGEAMASLYSNGRLAFQAVERPDFLKAFAPQGDALFGDWIDSPEAYAIV